MKNILIEEKDTMIQEKQAKIQLHEVNHSENSGLL